jgi:hypothetical protein
MNELIEEKRELDTGFMLIMEHFKQLFVDNSLSMDNFNKPDTEYNKLEKNISKNTASHFEYTNKVEMLQSALLQKYKLSNSQLHDLKNRNSQLHKKWEELMSFNNASVQMKSDAIFNYSKNNIIIFNYLFGSIFCFYIIHNL